MSIFTVQIRFKWWLPLYLNTLYFLAEMLGTEPDEDKVQHYVKKGITLEFINCNKT